ncbi:MAG: 2Fe-2S iron-sulfur cluster binding domain-containing protein [Oceanospirillales bacterium]|nr:2Fe-2S iron-sulfur cluster binding domain-containing protein [Oceanospirillales bacterium]MBR9888536.1 2Fe-2S iron-sulfur cluster binding domain-containing protein [Oceanospirillales bacterium]
MGITVQIEPVDKSFTAEESQTVLEAALKAGITLKHSCRNGQCGECRAPILSGAVSYKKTESIKLEQSDLEGRTGLMCVGHAISDLVIEAPEVTELEGISVQKCAGRTMAKETVSDDVAVLKIAPAPGVNFAFKPGQYLDLTIKGYATRSYSMASTDSEGLIELHVRKMPGGAVSPIIVDELKHKAIVTIEGPFGTFYVRDSDRPMVMIASGTGFAPVKSMMQGLIASGNSRPVALYWGGRAKQDLYMDKLCQQWAEQNSWFSYTPVLSENTDAGWVGRTGFVHQSVVDDLPDLSAYEVYVCGAPIVVSSAKRDCIGLCGLNPDHFFSDAFV